MRVIHTSVDESMSSKVKAYEQVRNTNDNIFNFKPSVHPSLWIADY